MSVFLGATLFVLFAMLILMLTIFGLGVAEYDKTMAERWYEINKKHNRDDN